MANVSLRNVGKSYGDVHISKDINLEINEGNSLFSLVRQVVVNPRYYE